MIQRRVNGAWSVLPHCHVRGHIAVDVTWLVNDEGLTVNDPCVINHGTIL
jgi:hypothetical protein